MAVTITPCPTCSGTAMVPEVRNAAGYVVSGGHYCETCRGTGLSIPRQPDETLTEAEARIDRLRRDA